MSSQLTLDDNSAKYQIRAYKPGYLQINDELYTQSLVLSSSELILNWPPQTFDQLKKEHLAVILQLKPTILLLGTGASLHFLDLEIYADLITQRIGVEVMDTSAASRTFNALTSEGRAVVAALIIQ